MAETQIFNFRSTLGFKSPGVWEIIQLFHNLIRKANPWIMKQKLNRRGFMIKSSAACMVGRTEK
jgi:hypothetical protein